MQTSHSHWSTKASLPPALAGGMAGRRRRGLPSPSRSPTTRHRPRRCPAGLGERRGSPAVPQRRPPAPAAEPPRRGRGERRQSGAKQETGPTHTPPAPGPPEGAGTQQTAPARPIAAALRRAVDQSPRRRRPPACGGGAGPPGSSAGSQRFRGRSGPTRERESPRHPRE